MSDQNDPVQWAIDSELNVIERAQKCVVALAPLRGVRGVRSAYASISFVEPQKVRVSLTLAEADAARKVVRTVLRLTGARRARKTFDESNGSVQYVIEDETRIVTISGALPAGCEIERIEEEVERPAEPARTEKRVRFVLKDAACLEGRRTLRTVEPFEEASA